MVRSSCRCLGLGGDVDGDGLCLDGDDGRRRGLGDLDTPSGSGGSDGGGDDGSSQLLGYEGGRGGVLVVDLHRLVRGLHNLTEKKKKKK